MGRRIQIASEHPDPISDRWEDWALLTGETVARSRTSETLRVQAFGLDLHLKRYRYSIRRAVQGGLRNTFLGPSRAAGEFRMLSRLGVELAPRPIALGEHRKAGFLREAFLATETVEGARPLDITLSRDGARALGACVGRLHAGGIVHGGLFPRNVLATPDGRYRVLDLDRARESRSLEDRAFDLACLAESVTVSPRACGEALRAWSRVCGEERRLREIRRGMAARSGRVRERMARRGRTR